jgi:hypothetical protein
LQITRKQLRKINLAEKRLNAGKERAKSIMHSTWFINKLAYGEEGSRAPSEVLKSKGVVKLSLN